ncbi:MAG: tetratricopeptide repeat protein [Myxococcota bacterium]
MTGELDASVLEARLSRLGDGPEDEAARIEIELELAWTNFYADRDRSRRLSERALERARALEQPRLEAVSLRNLAYCALVGGDYAASLPQAREAIRLFESLDEPVGKATALDIATHCLEGVGDYPRALETAVEALRLCRAHERPRETAWALANLASINVHTGDLDLAERTYLEALESFEAQGYAPGISRLKSLLGGLYQRMGRDAEALRYHQSALELAEQAGLSNAQGQALMDAGEILARMDRSDEALDCYDAAARCFEETNGVVQRGRVAVRRGQLFHQLGRPDDARAELDEAIDRLESAGASPDLLEAHRAYARSLDHASLLEAAAHHWRRAHDLLAEIMDEEQRKALDRIKTRLEIERAEKDAEIYRLRYVELAEMQSQLVERERLAVIGNLAAGVAHEVNTPMGVIRASVDVAQKAAHRLRDGLGDHAEDPKIRRAIHAMESSLSSSGEAVTRIQQMVQSLKNFAKLDEAQHQAFDLVEELENVLTLVAPKVSDGVALERHLAPVPRIEGHPSELNQAFMTILVNAAEATTEGSITVSTCEVEGGIQVEISDSGRGMEPEALERLFEPGFSKKGSRVRFRVGLPTASATVQRHGGRLEVDSHPGRGTRFLIYLPSQLPPEFDRVADAG